MDKGTSRMEMRNQLKRAGHDPDLLDDPFLAGAVEEPLTPEQEVLVEKLIHADVTIRLP